MNELKSPQKWGFRKPFAVAATLALTLSLIELLSGLSKFDGNFVVTFFTTVIGFAFWAYLIVRIRNWFIFKRKNND
ncbi:hypothetical protein [Parasphingorhabdus halotolerans]|uniref:Uncharacterized protein n=1 Tax=Parasphingorhabdus halotolerans TaxID=2725558 RepID=A0A6H2DKT5_9SPHN|nr:hypothetical protein [Parasphingorhabdus halotolerans]QJB68361.1 hypothetical protein HF685_02785 [Parasphingorhabdus halotolerans]